MADRLNPNDDLAVMGPITSPNGQYTLVMQGDGNLVLYRSGGKACWATGTDGQTVSQAIMQGDGNFVMYGPGGVYIWDTATNGHPGAWLIVQDDGNVVIYDPAGNPLWATNTNIMSGAVAGFLPSNSGFHFSNSWGSDTNYPVVTLPLVGTIVSGDAGNGLCGGFVLAALDLFLHVPRLLPPPDTDPPPRGSVIFNYLVERLLDSFGNVLQGPNANAARVIEWIRTPGHDVIFSFYGAGLARRVVETEWPKIKMDIDSGLPSPLNLVGGPERGAADVAGTIATLRHCHQVLAYAYELDSAKNLTLWVYDCNDPFNNNSTLSLNISDPAHTIPITSPAISKAMAGGIDVRGFFRSDYQLRDPNVLFNTNVPPTKEPVAQGNLLRPGEVLNAGQSIVSENGRYTFIYQGDGNLVLYRDGTWLWDSATGQPVGVCIMQGDGNLVIYGPGEQYVWDTATHGNPGSLLVVQDDGNVVIYRPDDTPVWATNTWQ